MDLVADFQIGEREPTKIHRHPDRTIERCELRNIPYDLFAPEEQSGADGDQHDDRHRERDFFPAVLALAGRDTGAARGDAFDIGRTVVDLGGRGGGGGGARRGGGGGGGRRTGGGE